MTTETKTKHTPGPWECVIQYHSTEVVGYCGVKHTSLKAAHRHSDSLTRGDDVVAVGVADFDDKKGDKS